MSNNSPLVSVIVPIFNGEAKLQRCLDSIKNQSYSNIEVIMINDGSTDGTASICDAYIANDSRFKVFTTDNCGAAHAKNIGLDNAHGDFIRFVDCDDYMHASSITILVDALNRSSSSGYVVGNYIKIYKGYTVKQRSLDAVGTYTSKEYLINTLKDPGHYYYGVNWNKLYRSDVIKNNNIRFREDVNLGEDFIFNLDVIMASESIEVIANNVYLYDCRADGLSRCHRSGLELCVREINNRKKIWEKYESCFNRFEIKNKYQAKMEDYWITFKIRQEYNLAHVFINWPAEDINEWKKIVQSDSIINMCVEHLGEKSFNRLKNRFFVIQRIKDLVKKTLNSLFGK